MSDEFEKKQVIEAMRKRCPALGGFVLRELADAAIETIDRIRKLKPVTFDRGIDPFGHKEQD